MPNDFLVGLRVMPHLIDDHSMSWKYITLHLVPLHEFRDINMPYSFGMSVNVGPSGKLPYDIQDT